MSAATTAATRVRDSIKVGVLATVCMDVVFVASSKLGGERFTSHRAGLEPVGRWAVGLARGRFRHEDITHEPAVPGEAAVGLAVHYLTGVALTWAYHAGARRRGHKPSLLSATAYGAATTLLPLLVMYPSWGLGAFALRSGETSRLVRIILLGHTAFGAAIGLWTIILGRGAAAAPPPVDG